MDIVTRGELFVMGKEIRTTNADEATGKGKIPGLWNEFVSEGIATSIPNRVAPDRIVAVYSDYESDANGPYSLLVGAEVNDIRDVPFGLVAKKIPRARYVRVLSERGAIPAIVFGVWKKIWGMSAKELGGDRAFGVDLEVYDERAQNRDAAQIEVYVSLK